MIRLAKPQDAREILAIYSPFILNTSVTFDSEVPTNDEFAARIGSILSTYPWLVYENNGQVSGYAYAGRYRERTCYQWAVETSVYIHENYMRSGIANALYDTLFSILKIQGFATAYAVINLPNERSVAFHEKKGFRYFATYENVGYKLGKWKNVGWWQLTLNKYEENPADPVPLSKMKPEIIQTFLKK